MFFVDMVIELGSILGSGSQAFFLVFFLSFNFLPFSERCRS